jgi:ketosteroid isomerase-like protein
VTQTTPLDRLFDHLAAGDVDAVMALLDREARVWHCFDRIAQDFESAERAFRLFVEHFPHRSFSGVRSDVMPGCVVRQHVMTTRTRTGEARAWEVCVVARLKDGRIIRIDEYLDRAGDFVPA